MIIKETGAPPCAAKHIGTVQEVIEAKLSAATTEKRIKASEFLYAFELATPKGINSLGEAIVVNGTCYTTSTDLDSPDYFRLIYGPDFIPGGLFILPSETKPSHQVTLDESLSMDAFYETLYQKIQQPFAFVGLFHFSSFHAMAISKPPIDGKNIFDNKQRYYDQPEIQRSGVDAYIMGVVAKSKELKPYNLDSVLYRNPFDTKSSLVYHAHALLLNKSMKEIESITPEDVEQCLHLLSDGTTMSSAETKIFALKGTTPWDSA